MPRPLDVSTIEQHFPFDTFRPGQREAIEFAARSFNEGKDIVIIEGPTGSGKSGIGYTLMDMHQQSYYLTITKILQDQLVSEFGEEQLVELKGRSSYPCTYWERYGRKLTSRQVLSPAQLAEIMSSRPNCAEGYCRTSAPDSEQLSPYKCTGCFLRESSPGFTPQGKPRATGRLTTLPPGMTYSACPYYEQVSKAVAARKVVMNFHSFLYQTQMTARFNEPRDLMVVDEAHNAEPVLLDFVAVTIDDRQLQRRGLTLPKFTSAVQYAIWMGDNQVGRILNEIIKDANQELTTGGLELKRKRELVRLVEDTLRTVKKYNTFMEDIQESGEWVHELTAVESRGETYHKLTLKPVLIHNFLRPLLLRRARRVLMLSATILDVKVLCDALGIDRSRVASYRMKNRFPVRNRPIYIQPVAKVVGGKNAMPVWGPKLVEKVNELVGKYPDARGIIHTHNFSIADMLLEQCVPAVRRRLTYQRRFHDKNELLEYHASRPDSVIIAPAMHEGVDLKDDLSRFQIITKVPYPNFHEDAQLRQRMEIDHRYYDWLTALKLVQAYGRSVRSPEDWAHTYIIDESIVKFLQQCKRMLPDWFKEAVICP